MVTEFGKKEKVNGLSAQHHGGSIVDQIGSVTDRHVTSISDVSPSGLKAPPFFVVEGKRVMSRLFDTLDTAWVSKI